jgi:hypothetical protein
MNTENELVIIPTAQLMSFIEALFERFLNQGKVPYHSLSGDPKKVYSRKQVAEILARTENTITKYIKQRKLVASRLNGIYYISETSLLNFINNTKNVKN